MGPYRKSIVALALTLTLLPRAGAAQALPTEAPAPVAAAAAPSGPLVGYRTANGRQLPVLQHSPYQAARRLWFWGFVGTMVGLGLSATGATVLMAGGIPEGTYTPEGRDRVMLAGGLMTGIGGAIAIAGGALWYVGSRDLRLLERNLPAADGVLSPALSLSF